jgi:hypothetical protein
MLLSAAGMLMFTGVTVNSSYGVDVLPGLLTIGIGLGLIFAPAMDTATRGVDGPDAGVASALVNTGQQVGGSVGTALLSTLAASATGAYASSHGTGFATQAAVHGYTTAFTWAAAIFAVGALIAWLLLPSGAPEVEPGAAVEPVFAH